MEAQSVSLKDAFGNRPALHTVGCSAHRHFWAVRRCSFSVINSFPGCTRAKCHLQTLEVCHVSTSRAERPAVWIFGPAFWSKGGLNLISAKPALTALMKSRMELQHLHFWTAWGRYWRLKKEKNLNNKKKKRDAAMFCCQNWVYLCYLIQIHSVWKLAEKHHFNPRKEQKLQCCSC